MTEKKIIEGLEQVLAYAKYRKGDPAWGEDVLGMTCCDKGRIGDGHGGCYLEALFKQKRNGK